MSIRGWTDHNYEKAVERRDYLRRWLTKNYVQATAAEVRDYRDSLDSVHADVTSYERRLARQARVPKP